MICSSHHRGWSRVCHARKQIFGLRNSEIQTRKNARKNTKETELEVTKCYNEAATYNCYKNLQINILMHFALFTLHFTRHHKQLVGFIVDNLMCERVQ